MNSWSNSNLNVLPSFSGTQHLLKNVTKPPELLALPDISERWISAMIAMSAHNMHRNGNHLDSDLGFHPLTVEHYSTGIFEGISEAEKRNAGEDQRFHLTCIRHIIYDLCTLLDRLSGGSTIVLHHPGATAPQTDLTLANLTAKVYIDPKVLHDHPSLHIVAAELVQTFIQHWARPVAQAFRDRRISRGWRQISTHTQVPTPIPRSDPQALVPLPVDMPSACSFEFIGRHPGSLEQILSSHTVHSHFPNAITTGQLQVIKWSLKPISSFNQSSAPSISSAESDSRSQCSTAHIIDQSASANITDIVIYAESLPPSARLGLPIGSRPISPTVRSRVWDPSSPQHATSSDNILASPVRARGVHRSNAFDFASVSPPISSTPRRLRSFGDNTKNVLRRLGILDTFHEVCRSISLSHLDDAWGAELAKMKEFDIGALEAEEIALAMHYDSPKLTRNERAIVTERRRQERSDEDAAIAEVLEYIENKATELATRFRRTPRRYLEHFYIGSALRRKKHIKTSAWSVFMHFKGKDINKDRDSGKRDNIQQLVKNANNYHSLTAEERAQLVTAFDEEKNAARVKPPNLSVKTSNGECSSSFAAVVDELEALKQRIGTEALVILVRGGCNLNLQPKVHFTCAAAEQFLRTATRKDPMEFACKLEGYILSGAKQTIRSGMQAGLSKCLIDFVPHTVLTYCAVQITGKTNINFEYLRYEAAVVQEHLVKVVGWNHKDWANPSDLKGGIEALETLASAVKAKTCKFVKITASQAEERLLRIAAGEVLTPNFDKDSTDIQVTSPAPSRSSAPSATT
ncbi:uncharacterized protein HD556DRAFT_1206501, partial [Suillus plorans]